MLSYGEDFRTALGGPINGGHGGAFRAVRQGARPGLSLRAMVLLLSPRGAHEPARAPTRRALRNQNQ
ncbi:unnamed protein product, partial [Closterium sp. NIES-54]